MMKGDNGVRRWLSPHGRIGRHTYWFAYLIPIGGAQLTLSFIVMTLVAHSLGQLALLALDDDPSATALTSMEQVAISGADWTVFIQLALVLLWVPILAGAAKRWRDLGQSPWWTLLVLIPGLGMFIAVVLGCLRGQPGPRETLPAAAT
jgi:uncharacterized membrane protein YhaH (DUF805 family)